MDYTQSWKSALYAAIAGDALGVPVEHSARHELTLCSVKNMLGYGRYDQPKGTWSDDTSMTMCTAEVLIKGYDVEELGRKFCAWIFDGEWTPWGYVFDSGITTFTALDKIRNDEVSAKESGGDSEDDNGNGSLMRILPAALYFADEDIEEYLKHIHEISAITHAHPRAMMGCGIYACIAKELLTHDDKVASFRAGVKKALEYYQFNETFAPQLRHYGRILSHGVEDIDRQSISSSGYVVHTLEAALWCFLRHDNTKDILLEAVNLGLDTDTTGCVAGGLAGLFHGLDGVPDSWLDSLARKEEIDKTIDLFSQVSASRKRD